MKIIVQKVENDIVHYSTEYGLSKAKWKGEYPIVNQEYFVEIEIEELFSEGINIIKVDKLSYNVGLIGEKAIFTGVLETVESDGYAVLRIGESLIPIEIKKGVFIDGNFARLVVKKVSIYPCNY